MNEFEKLVCEQVSEFVKKNIKSLCYKPSYYAFKNKEDMIKRIREDFQDACWALTELLNWGMNLDNPFIQDEYNESLIYCIKDSENKSIYFKVWLNDNYVYVYNLVKPVEKTIIVWE